MTTDVWQRARDGITRFWQRTQPDRAELVSAELDACREEALAATASEDQEMLAELRSQWEGRLRRLLMAHPQAVGELRRLLEEIAPAPLPPPPVAQHATASGRGRVYQAGRDQHITER